MTADGQTIANMTNLAIKGIIAIQAMANMSEIVGQQGDAASYRVSISIFWNTVKSSFRSQSFVTANIGIWQSLALSPDQSHLLASYGDASTSSALMYNLFADLLLRTGVVSSAVRVFPSKTQKHDELTLLISSIKNRLSFIRMQWGLVSV